MKISQSKLAVALGVTSNTVARWERGDLDPPKVAELAAEYVLVLHKQQKAQTQQPAKLTTHQTGTSKKKRRKSD